MSGISKVLISDAIDAYENAPGVMQFAAMSAAAIVFDAHHQAQIAELRAELEESEKAINVWRGRTQRAEAAADALRNELSMILEWATSEQMPLREQEIRSIRKAMGADA
jgi:hypothetical protein